MDDKRVLNKILGLGISKQNVEVWLDFSFCHLVKFESTVKIEERPVKCEPGDLDKYQIVMLYT